MLDVPRGMESVVRRWEDKQKIYWYSRPESAAWSTRISFKPAVLPVGQGSALASPPHGARLHRLVISLHRLDAGLRMSKTRRDIHVGVV